MLTALTLVINLFGAVDKWNSHVKTFVIVLLTTLLMGGVFLAITYYTSHNILRGYAQQVQEDKELAEQYTKMIAPVINREVEYIIDKDPEATNVLLLNYHNTITSTQGLSYRYLTPLTEKRNGIETSSCIRLWKELEYINYGDEIEKINSNTYLRIDSLEEYQKALPNFTELVHLSGAKSAAFYPIIGIDGSIGMIVVLYKEHKVFPDDYYKKVIAPVIQPMSSLLDYNTIKNRYLGNANEVIKEYVNKTTNNRQE